MADAIDRPFALFGHSMGAAVAYEVALALRRRGVVPPVHLFVSAREAPEWVRGGDVHLRDDDGICAELTRVGGTPPELLSHPELRALILPVVRSDYRLVETYRPTLAPVPLGCPVTVVLGDADSEATPEEAEAWRSCTTGRFRVEIFPGGHFYLVPQRAAVVSAVAARLGAPESKNLRPR